MNREVTRTERGWAGHFICSSRCRFRRNTLLKCGEVSVVVSTVGLFFVDHNSKQPETIGFNRFYETMAFMANRPDQDKYEDANIARQISFESPWSIEVMDAEIQANDMHEAVVNELTQKLQNGNQLEE